MASSSNKEGTKEVFKWTDKDTIILCEVCLQFIKDNGRSQCFKWKEIQIDVEKKIGRPFSNLSSCKHKYDAMRRDWRNWTKLKSSETGLGWDPNSGKIDASDEWWQRKIKGVNSTLETNWDKLFGDSYATGENVYVPSMDHIEDLTVGNENTEEEFVENRRVDDFTTELLDEGNFFRNFVEQARNGATSGNRGGGSQVVSKGADNDMHSSKKQPMTKQNSVPLKRARRQSAGSAMLAKEISEMSQCVKLMSQSSSIDSIDPSMSTIPVAMKMLNRMVENYELEKCSDLWFYATTVIQDPSSREVFFSMEDDETRIKWLQYLLNEKNKH
ncbi:uncharacterized protein LOC125497952 [Beta vulgaris subsp. vulgaris]|uniref:uncharacterized protein LOC125497952 n=1 Tax=Beta vulgaris subsp. vulgaris TaxID=3555 RepID=UPI002549545F|nr:uncharacterized protein LOC125497952 [Beta vulgaris subsp. vulgaris]